MASNNQLIEALMVEYNEAMEKRTPETKYSAVFHKLPINKIDGMECNVILVMNCRCIRMVINTNRLYTDCCHIMNDNLCNYVLFEKHFITVNETIVEQSFVFKKEHFVKVLVELKTLLPKLRFNRLKGKLTDKDETQDISQLFCVFLSDMKNVDTGVEECCVCSEKTFTKTPCGHTLCIQCWERIKPTRVCGDEFSPLCPMCREDISFEDKCNCNE